MYTRKLGKTLYQATRVFRSPLVGGLAAAWVLSACSVTPEPLAEDQRQARVASDLEAIRAQQYTPAQPVSLYEAMARAVAFNLQHNVRQIERDIARLELEQSNLEGYPDIDGDASYDRDSAKTSADTDRNIRSGNFGSSWNVLDLGVSYAKAQQSADRVLIAEERRRKALQDIIRNVRLAYWKAVGAQQLMARMVSIEQDFTVALAESRRLEVKNVETRRRTVGFRRGLVDTVRQIIAARKEYGKAKFEFAQLINIQPGVRFSLAPPEAMQGIPAMPMAVDRMEAFALEQRPELRVEDYNERITEWESREALYGMFPSLDLSFTRSFTSDKGLVNTSWTGVGSQLGMNLFRLFSGPLRMRTAELKGEMARRQRVALSVGVLAQVHIAYHEFHEAKYQFRLARQISRSDRELSKLALMEQSITQGNQLDAIDVAARQLRSEVQQHQAYVELRRAHGNVLHALGLDVIDNEVPLDDVDRLRTAIRQTVGKWETLIEDDDPADDTTVEDLVVQVLADVRNDGVAPTPIGGNGQAAGQPPATSTTNQVVDNPAPEPTLAAVTLPQAQSEGSGNTDATEEDPFEVQFKDVLASVRAGETVTANNRNIETSNDSGLPERPESALPQAGDTETMRSEASLPAPPAIAAGVEELVPPAPVAVAAAPSVTEPADDATSRKPPAQVEAALAVEALSLETAADGASEMTADSSSSQRQTALIGAGIDAPSPQDKTAIAPPQPRQKRRLPRYDAQFGAFSEYARALALLATMRDLNTSKDSHGEFSILRKRAAGKPVLYHVRFGSYLGWSAARDACDRFKSQGRSCVVVRHKPWEGEIIANCRDAKGCDGARPISLSENHPPVTF